MLRWPIYLLVFAFFAVFLLVPVATAVAAGVTDPATGGFSLAFLHEAVANPIYRDGLWNALGIACVATLLAFCIALPAAWVMARHAFAGKGLAEVLLLAPLVLPPFVGALGFEAVLGRHGALNALLVQLGWCDWSALPDWLGGHRFLAVCVIEALGLYPFLYLTTAAAISRLDPALLEAAQVAGATPLTVFRRIWLPLLRPGLFAGGVVVFVWAFTELGTPLMLGYDRHIAVQVFAGLAEAEKNRLPFAQVILMLVVAAGAYVAARALFARQERALAAKGSAGGQPVQLSRRGTILAWLLIGGIVGLAAAPHAAVAVLAVAQDWYRSVLPAGLTTTHLRDALAHPQVVDSILMSLKYSSLATALALVLGTYIAWVATRWRPKGWQALDLLAMLPLAIPGIILAFGYRAMPAIPGFGWLNPVVDPTILLALAYGVRRLPYVVRAAAAGYEQTPVTLEEAAAVSGAGAWTRLRRIVLPLLAASLAAGAILAFSFSMLEVADSLILAERREHWPITKVMFGLTDILGNGPAIACAFATWAMLFLAAAFAAARALTGRGVGSSMRA
jgi:iron(III) transport system permease protein